MAFLKKILSAPFILFIYVYKYAISPLTPASCRHYPTCSTYAVESLKTHGPLKGGVLAVKRISSCHPWSSGGIDPVPKVIVKKLKFKESGETERI